MFPYTYNGYLVMSTLRAAYCYHSYPRLITRKLSERSSGRNRYEAAGRMAEGSCFDFR